MRVQLGLINVSREAGQPAFALPFQVLPELDGLLLYMVFVAGPDALTAGELIRRLRRALDQWRREQRENQRDDEPGGGPTPVPVPVRSRAPREIPWDTVVIVVVVLLLIAAVVLLAMGNVPAAIIAAILAALGALGSSPAVIPVMPSVDPMDGLAASWRFNAGALHAELRRAHQQDDDPRPVNVKMPGVELQIPSDRVTPMFGFLAEAVHGAQLLQHAFLSRRLNGLLRNTVGVG